MRITFAIAHMNVVLIHGEANKRECLSCDGWADDWVYDQNDPNAFCSRNGELYSANVNRYIPLCRSCHERFDLDAMVRKIVLERLNRTHVLN